MAIRVLLIEDDVNDRELQERALHDAGFKVITAVNGKDGFATALANRPDIVLCDVQMPHGSGYLVAESFKSNRVLGDIPVIALTGQHGMFADEKAALEAGADALLLKPLDVLRFTKLAHNLCRM